LNERINSTALDNAPECPPPNSVGGDVFVFPTTPGQFRFWSLDQLKPGNPALNMPLAWNCDGSLDIGALRTALDQLVERHEVLRATFEYANGRLSQVIHEPSPVSLTIDDLQSFPDSARDAMASEAIQAEAERAMDLAKGPLFRARLLKLAERRHILLVTLHHIICDGWSNGIVLRDLFALYDGLCTRSIPLLPALPIQYPDFADWLDQWMRGPGPAASIAHWKAALGEKLPRLNLWRDSDTQPDSKGDIETLLIAPDLAAKAREYCKRENLTLFMLLMATFAALLRRVSGQRDFLIGSPCANRRPETENLIGLFANPQVIRITTQENTSFSELLKLVRDWSSAASEHQELPFETLNDLAHFAQAENRIHLQAYFLYQKAFMQPQRLRGLEVVPIRSVSPGAMFDLMLGVVERAEGPRLQLEYNPARFRPETIRSLLKSYSVLLASAISQPDQCISEINLLDVEDRQKVLRLSADRESAAKQFEPLHLLIEKQCARTPSALAVVYGNDRWTYSEFSEYCRRITNLLLQRALPRGTPVAIYMAQPFIRLAAVVSVLKAGGICVPISAEGIAGRVRRIVEHAGVELILADDISDEELDVRIPVMRVVSPVSSSRPLSYVGGDTEGNSPAFIMYSLSSAGDPTGVRLTHQAISNLFQSLKDEPGLRQNDVLVAATAPGIDFAGVELLWPLITGATVAIAKGKETFDGFELRNLLLREGATVLQTSPQVWRILLGTGWKGIPGLKALCGGRIREDLSSELLQRCEEVWHLFGRRASAIWSAATRERKDSSGLIGKPIPNTRFSILDTRRAPVPPGVVGELYVGGPGAAAGYWRKPELTFNCPISGDCLHATGDFARLRQDGRLELLMQPGDVVSFRGHQVELHEIEEFLMVHPAVRDAAVLLTGDGTREKRLIAYVAVLPESQNAETNRELRSLMMSGLPEYMVPAAIRLVSEIPRTASGAPAVERLHESVDETPTQEAAETLNPVESQLAAMWRRLLGLTEIHRSTDFYDVGGTSLTVIQLFTEINRHFSSDLRPSDIFRARTLGDLALAIRESQDRPSVSVPAGPLDPTPIRANGQGNPLFLLHDITGYVLTYEGIARHLSDRQVVYAIESRGHKGMAPDFCVETMAANYIEQIKRVQPSGPYHLAGHSFGGILAYEVARQLQEMGETLGSVILIDAASKQAFDGQNPPKHFAWSYTEERVRRLCRRVLGLSYRTLHFAFRAASLPIPRLLWNVKQANKIASRAYLPQPANIAATLVRCQPESELDALHRSLGWSRVALGGIVIREFPGDHASIVMEPAVQAVASCISEMIAQTELELLAYREK
jgi:non-ribosomal peptide synthetase component F/thioesterase domain-containing protein